VSGPRKLRRDAEENRRRVLAAADAVFAEQGLGAGVSDVARAAGVGVGTLYRRFPTKEALVAELAREVLDGMLASARSALEMPDGAGLEQFVWVTAAGQADRPGCLGRVWDDAGDPVLLAECRDLIGRLLADAQAHGRVRADATVDDVDLLFWSLRGVLTATRTTRPDAWRRHVELVLAGLRPAA
jgi:AcrR family transcriptional regulator